MDGVHKGAVLANINFKMLYNIVHDLIQVGTVIFFARYLDDGMIPNVDEGL